MISRNELMRQLKPVPAGYFYFVVGPSGHFAPIYGYARRKKDLISRLGGEDWTKLRIVKCFVGP